MMLITINHSQSEKPDLEALCQTKDKIIRVRATENQQQAEIIQHQKSQLEQLEVHVSSAYILSCLIAWLVKLSANGVFRYHAILLIARKSLSNIYIYIYGFWVVVFFEYTHITSGKKVVIRVQVVAASQVQSIR